MTLVIAPRRSSLMVVVRVLVASAYDSLTVTSKGGGEIQTGESVFTGTRCPPMIRYADIQ
jgi:hypothetical protein